MWQYFTWVYKVESQIREWPWYSSQIVSDLFLVPPTLHTQLDNVMVHVPKAVNVEWVLSIDFVDVPTNAMLC